MGVHVGGVAYVIAHPLQPMDEVDFPVHKLGPGAIWAVKRNLDGSFTTRDGIGSVAVEVVEALAYAIDAVVGPVVIRLVSIYALLVEDVRHAAVIAQREDDIVLVKLGVGKFDKVDAGGPGSG